MTLLSAHEDLVFRTLAAIRGRMARLVYLARLRNDAGRYEHWGLARTHGELPAERAVAQAHTEAFLEVLRTPLAKLVADYQEFQDSADEPGAGKGDLLRRAYQLVPGEAGGGGRTHFSLVVAVLCSLEQSRRSGKRQAA